MSDIDASERADPMQEAQNIIDALAAERDRLAKENVELCQLAESLQNRWASRPLSVADSTALEADLAEARETIADYEEGHQITIDDCGAPDEKHCSCVPSLRLEIKRLRAERDQLRAALGDCMLEHIPGLGMQERRDDLAEARAEIQNLGKRESDYKELYQEARGLLRQVGGEDWHHHAGCSSNANSIDDCDCMPGMARAFLSRTEGK